MKKVLSVVLAVIMLFSVMSIGASAATTTDLTGVNGNIGDVVLVLRFGEGKSTDYLNVYNPDTHRIGLSADHTGEVIVVSEELLCGYGYALPSVSTPPEEKNFDGWLCNNDGKLYAPGINGTFVIPDVPTTNNVIVLTAQYSTPAEAGDTMETVLNVLVKVFGAIIGILLYGGDTGAGVAMMNKILGGLEL